ncbi:AAA family ATPase [Streptomyces sp. NPDC126497]|uniref:helix-turn-helix transcriptional regulator n=1 Tax=Streptomyces sp. NPDC126497 TaxID=3155313 RepID=UPI003321B8DF
MHATSPTVIGRAGEMQDLEKAVQRGREHRGTTVFVVGEPGIGKTRLVDHVAGRARNSTTVLRGRCSGTGATIALRPLAEALLSLDRTGATPRDPELRPYRVALSTLVPQWREHSGPHQPESLIVLAEATLRLLASIGREQGCLLVLEDLHDADAESIAVTEYLMDNLAGLPVTLFATLRPDDGPALDLAYQGRNRNVGRIIELQPLAAQDVAELTAACLGTPVSAVPSPVVQRIQRDADGIPLTVEELLNGMITARALQRTAVGEWHLTRDLDTTVPATLTRSIAARADRLDPQGRAALDTAAVLGRRFSAGLLQLVTGLDDRSLHIHLRTAVDVRLILPDGADGDMYVFRHALTAQALLSSLLPGQRAAIARQAADALEKARADRAELPEEWRELVVDLRCACGDRHQAGLLLVEAGKQALQEGFATKAAALLGRSLELLSPRRHKDAWADAADSLFDALTESGAVERAFAFAEAFAEKAVVYLDDTRRVRLHARLAWAASMVGRWEEAAGQVRTARLLLGDDRTSQEWASVDIVDGYVRVRGGRPVSGVDTARVETLVRRAIETAERIGRPVVVCQGLQLLALLARSRSFDEANSHLRRILTVADRHGLGLWRARALGRLAGNQGLLNGSTDQLEQAHRVFLRSGAITSAYQTEASLAMLAVLRGEHQKAALALSHCAPAFGRLGHTGDLQYTYVIQAVSAAHRGKRREMEKHLADYRDHGGEGSEYTPVVLGLCHAVSALLDEDRAAARAALAQAREWDLGHPSAYSLYGRYGLELLVAAVDADTDRDRWEIVGREASARLRWNLQFTRFSSAVLLGRASRHEEAVAAIRTALEASAPFPLARHLGLRLAAEAALRDGWGTPGVWLRTAEEYFHDEGMTMVASACRALLRQAGMPATQRRSGHAHVPEALRRLGVTAREYEVLGLLARRYGNNEIARCLFISPRTAEKHVASLLAKTGSPERSALCEFAGRAAGEKE